MTAIRMFAFLLAAFLFTGSAATAQETLFRASENGAVFNRSALLNAVPIEMSLPNGRRVVAVGAPTIVRSMSDVSWQGSTDDGGSLFLSTRRGRVFGHVALGDGTEWSISTTKNGEIVVWEADPLECGVDDHDHAPTLAPKANPAPPTEAQVVDVLVLATPEKVALEGMPNIHDRAVAEIDYLNIAMLNSGRTARFELVGVELIAYQGSGNTSADLQWLSDSSEVAALRELHDADLVSLDTTIGDLAGTAYSGPNPDLPYSVVVSGFQGGPNITVRSHEIGHNLGLHHNVENAPGPGNMHGHWWCNAEQTQCWRSTMSYNDSCPTICGRVPHFSNPHVTYNGVPTGVAGVSEAAIVGEANAAIVADFMERATSPGGCVADADTMCLLNDRFAVEVGWQRSDGSTGVGMVSGGHPDTDESGRFYFFSSSNTELIVKMLDACVPALGNTYWVFLAGLTNVGVNVVVTDTVTGTTRSYHNPLNEPMQAVQDTSAFATCGATN